MKTHYVCLAILIVLLGAKAKSQWVQTSGPTGFEVPALVSQHSSIFAAIFIGDQSTSPTVYRSTDEGANWSPTGLDTSGILALGVQDSVLFAGTAGRGVYRSTDNGATWAGCGLKDTIVLSFAALGNILYAGTKGSGMSNSVFRSSDYGTHWMPTGLADVVVETIGASGSNLVAGCSLGAFLSTDGGNVWTASGLTNIEVSAIAFIGPKVFAGCWREGVFFSDDSGKSWTAMNTGMRRDQSGYYRVRSLATSGTTLFAGTSMGVFVYANGGSSWTHASDGLADTVVESLSVAGAYLVAGTDRSIWRCPLSDLITSTNGLTSEFPEEFRLCQNYPNPFNPSTTIKYELPRASQVTLSVFDVLSREVSVLVNERENAGAYEVRFDGSGLASGVYFYRLQAGSFVQTKKLLLVR